MGRFSYFYYLCTNQITTKMRKTVITALLTIIAVGNLWAWGSQGHSTIAYLAERHLTERAKSNISHYIGGRSIVYYASWMDFNRKYPPFDVTNNWHVDYWTDDERTDTEGKPLPPNSVSQISRIIEQMSDFRQLSDSLVNINIRFLTHLVGDMHCPVHIDFPKSRPMRVTIDGKVEKVHAMWDSKIIDRNHKGCSAMQLAEEFDIYTAEQIAAVQQGTPEDWYAETVAATTRALEMIPADGVLTDENYFNKAIVIAEERQTVAGYRLAMVLNAIFDK